MTTLDRIIMRANFDLAVWKLCEKMGWTREHSWYFRNRAVDSFGTPERAEFRRKVIRFLAYNYDNHRCPEWYTEPHLLPEGREGALPIIYPPEYRT